MNSSFVSSPDLSSIGPLGVRRAGKGTDIHQIEMSQIVIGPDRICQNLVECDRESENMQHKSPIKRTQLIKLPIFSSWQRKHVIYLHFPLTDWTKPAWWTTSYHLLPQTNCFQVAWSMMRNWLAIAFSVSNPPALKAKASLILAIVLKAFPCFFGVGVGVLKKWCHYVIWYMYKKSWSFFFGRSCEMFWTILYKK